MRDRFFAMKKPGTDARHGRVEEEMPNGCFQWMIWGYKTPYFCRATHIPKWVFPKIMGVYPQIIHLFIGFSMKFSPIHFGGKPPIFWVDTQIVRGHQQKSQAMFRWYPSSLAHSCYSSIQPFWCILMTRATLLVPCG